MSREIRTILAVLVALVIWRFWRHHKRHAGVSKNPVPSPYGYVTPPDPS